MPPVSDPETAPKGLAYATYAVLSVFGVLFAALLVHCDPVEAPDDAPGDVSTLDAPIDGGRCGVCPSERPHCDEAEGLCVECEDRSECTPPLLGCMNGRCVSCETNRDCPTLEASECYFGTHACRPCTGDDACMGREGTPRCIEGRCAP